MLRDMPALVEPQPGIVRHLARNEDKVVADDRRHKAGGSRRGNARRMEFCGSRTRLRAPPAISDVDIVASAGEAALHNHRGARRDVVAEFGVPAR